MVKRIKLVVGTVAAMLAVSVVMTVPAMADDEQGELLEERVENRVDNYEDHIDERIDNLEDLYEVDIDEDVALLYHGGFGLGGFGGCFHPDDPRCQSLVGFGGRS